MKVKFQEVHIRVHKTGKCVVCGKRRKRTKKFWQTLNPWNKGSDGIPKTERQILDELSAQADEWRDEPINCCE